MIKNFKLKKNNVEIFFANRKSKIYPNIWLRDHIKNTENWDFRTNQRKTFTANLTPDLKAVKGKILENGKLLSITWSDSSSPAKYSHKFLLNYSTKTCENILLAKMNLTKLYLKVFHFLKFCP